MTFIAPIQSPRRTNQRSLLLEMRRVGFDGGDGFQPVQDVDLAVHRREAVAIVGAGRSTIVRLMAGDLKASKGTISRLADASSRHVVLMPRGDPEISGRLSIADLAAELFPDADDDGVARRWVRSGLERAGFDLDGEGDLLDVLDPVAVQRLALARAVMARPNLIVADEPFAALPRKDVVGLLSALVSYRSRRSAVVVCTQRIEVAEMCSRVVNLGQNEGAVNQPMAG